MYLIPKKKSDVQLNGNIKFDGSLWKSNGIKESQNEFDERYEEIKNQFEKLQEDFYWNKIVYESKFNFEPKIGNIYHLYENENENILSIISPTEWKKKHIGSFRLKYNMKWERIN
jgi:hypothetical protein